MRPSFTCHIYSKTPSCQIGDKSCITTLKRNVDLEHTPTATTQGLAAYMGHHDRFRTCSKHVISHPTMCKSGGYWSHLTHSRNHSYCERSKPIHRAIRMRSSIPSSGADLHVGEWQRSRAAYRRQARKAASERGSREGPHHAVSLGERVSQVNLNSSLSSSRTPVVCGRDNRAVEGVPWRVAGSIPNLKLLHWTLGQRVMLCRLSPRLDDASCVRFRLFLVARSRLSPRIMSQWQRAHSWQ